MRTSEEYAAATGIARVTVARPGVLDWDGGGTLRQAGVGLGYWLWSWWSAGGTVWLVCLGVQLLLARGGVRRLPRLSERPALPVAKDEALASLTVIVAARNEAATVAPAVGSILQSEYPHLRVLAIDDRSTDRTGEILDHLALQDDRLQVLRVKDLPPGWLGKNHALHLAAGCVDSEWLLFTDADVRFSPSALRRAVLLCERERLDHLTAAPALLASGLWLRLFLGWYALVLTLWLRPWDAPRRDHRASVGVGAFNLVRRSAYLGVGGHAALPLAVADDVVLGRLLKSAGYRQMMVMARGRTRGRREEPQLQLQWYPDLKAAIQGLEKNAFAMFNYRTAPLLGTAAGATLVTLGPWVAVILAPGWHRLPWIAGVALSGASLSVAGGETMDNFPWALSLLYPLAQGVLTWTALRSAWLTLSRGGVRWRDTFYPLHELRSAQLGARRARLR